MTFGLEGIVVANTKVSSVDGERGRLIIAGRDVESLGDKISFEKMCALLWDSQEPDLAEGRQLAFEQLPAMPQEDGMDALRAACAQLAVSRPAIVTGAMAVFAAAWWRQKLGCDAIAPRADLDHATDYLRMVTGEQPHPSAARAMATYLCTVSDHGMNASTFAARVVTSTGSDIVSAIVAAIGALKGPLHGGAPGPVLDMLDAIKTGDRAAAWLAAELAAGRRIMGIGHRVYRVRDPRAAVLERTAGDLADRGRLQLARRVEAEAVKLLAERHPDRPLRANVEFYTAVLLEALGIDRRMFSPTFAAGRVAGWCAHIREQRAEGRLIRPRARYVGAMPTVPLPVVR